MDQLAQLLMNRQQGTGQAHGAPSGMWSNMMGLGSSMAGPANPAKAPQAAANYAAVNRAAAPAAPAAPMAQMAPPATPVAQMAPPVAAGPKQLPSGVGAWGGVLRNALGAGQAVPGGSPVAARLQGIMQKLMMHRQQGMHIPQDTGSAMHAAPAGPTPGMMIPMQGAR